MSMGSSIEGVYKSHKKAVEAALNVDCCFKGGWSAEGEDYWTNGCDFVSVESWGRGRDMKALVLIAMCLHCSSAVEPSTGLPLPGPAVYCVTPDAVNGPVYQTCNSSSPWHWGYNSWPYRGGFICSCDEVCGVVTGCPDGTKCVLPDGQDGVCEYVPAP
jgi:hypothetical protein